MRCSVWSSLAISVCSALVFAAPAAAHVSVVPPFVAAGRTETLTLTVPNERDRPMTELIVSVTSGIRIVEAHTSDSWSAEIRGEEVIWSGGTLAPAADGTFALEVKALIPPGTVSLAVEQRYPDTEKVIWSVPLTVTPADESSQYVAWATVVAIAGLLVMVGLVALAWRRRRTRSLQEK